MGQIYTFKYTQFPKNIYFYFIIGKNLFTSCFQVSITNYFEPGGNLQIWRMNWKLGAVFGDGV